MTQYKRLLSVFIRLKSLDLWLWSGLGLNSVITQHPQWRHLLNPYYNIALGLGSGLAPKAPGSAGTLCCMLMVLALTYAVGMEHQPIPLYWYLGVLVFLVLGGVYCINRYFKVIGRGDNQHIVIDEFAGYWLAIYALPLALEWLLIAFVIFRFFDIYKPYPIAWLDKNISGSWGVMVDDLMAGVYTLITLQGLRWVWQLLN